MTSWKNILYKIGSEAEKHFDRYKLSFRDMMGWETGIQICPYITYCNSDTLFIKGRVLQDKGLEITQHDTAWKNILNMYRRFNSNEIPGATLKISFSKTIKEVTSDEDGYFETTIPLSQSLPGEELWHHPVLELLKSPIAFKSPIMARCEVMTPPVTAQFGIISDIDDTILITHATSIYKLASMTFFKNAYSRLPFDGVASLLQAFQQGVAGINYNPVFYVSSSPWNLYDLLIDFMKVNKIPAGPMLLNDFGFSDQKLFFERHDVHKIKSISNVLNAYPALPFILIGDSGQKDPEIYAQIMRTFPKRILAAYIRDVSVDKRDVEVVKIAGTLSGEKMEMVLVADSYAASTHAAEHGFISQASHKLLMAEKLLDKQVNTFEDIIDKEPF